MQESVLNSAPGKSEHDGSAGHPNTTSIDTAQRPPDSSLPRKILALCNAKESVTSRAAQSPNEPLHAIATHLYQSNGYHPHGKGHVKDPGLGKLTKEDLDTAASCGNFPYRPSDLFLKVYAQVLRLLEHDPLASMVSPPLLGSSGVITLSIVSVIPDIMRHYADVIVQAEREVFLTTNYWEASTSAKVITDALRELDRRAGKRGQKVVVKIVYDRGNLGQLSDPHQIVPVKEYTGDKVKLPKPEDVPNLSLEVCNYHKPVLGTMHGKWMCVDRRVALINSNNIQDRVNVEMMTQIEGQIVQGFYDLCLITWHHAMNPPLPLLSNPPKERDTFDFGSDHAQIANQDLEASKGAAIETLKTGAFTADKAQSQGKSDHKNTYETTPGEEAHNDATDFNSKKGHSKIDAITRRLNTTLNPNFKGTDSQTEDFTDFAPHILHKESKPFPIALVNRKPRGSLDFNDVDNRVSTSVLAYHRVPDLRNPAQDIAWIAAMENAEHEIFIQTPTFTAPPAVEAVLRAARRGVVVTIYADLGKSSICLDICSLCRLGTQTKVPGKGFNDAGEALPKQGKTYLSAKCSSRSKGIS